MARSQAKPRRPRAAKSFQHPTNIALDLLLSASTAAHVHGRDRWEFALDVEHLLAAGVTPTSLRELICAGLIESAIETTELASDVRKFRRLSSLTLSAKTCFMLTEDGERVALSSAAGKARSTALTEVRANNSRAMTVEPRPRWDRAARKLLLGRDVVKHFRVPSRCQELILQVFEEAGWPSYIDDPLPPHNGQDRRVRLHNAVRALNGHHRLSLIRFTTNGNGKGVHWSHFTPASSSKEPRRTARRH